MAGNIKPFNALLLTVMMILSTTAVFTMSVFGMGYVPAPPVSGDWVISGTESYQDTGLTVTGNLIVQNGGSLTLRNVTLCMNVTASSYPVTIKVEAGGTLNIWDADGDPTTPDGSLVTDSTFDTDDLTTLDYRYYFNIEKEGMLQLNNSVVEECGESSGTNKVLGLYIEGNNSVVENTTFKKCGYGVVVYKSNNTLIKSINATGVTRLIKAQYADYLTIDNCVFDLDIPTYGIEISNCDHIKVTNNNVKSFYNPFKFSNLGYAKIYNNTGEKTTTTLSQIGISIIGGNNNHFDGLTSYGGSNLISISGGLNNVFQNLYVTKTITHTSVRYYGVSISGGTNNTLKDSNIIDMYEDGLQLSSVKDSRVTNCTIDGGRNNGIYMYQCSDVMIDNNSISHFSSFHGYGGITIKSSSGNIIKDNWIGYNTNQDIYMQLASYNDIINNTIGTYFNDKCGIYVTGAGSSGSDYNYIAHNRISETRTGIYFGAGDYNIVENTTFNGNNVEHGVWVSKGKNNELRNCTIKDYQSGARDPVGLKYTNCLFDSNYYGIDGTNVILENVTINNSDREGLDASGFVIARNSTFINSASIYKDVKVASGAEVVFINCSHGDEDVLTNGKLWIKWWLDVYVNDSNGPVPGAVVRVFNGTDDEEVNGTAGEDGNITLALTEKLYYGSWIDFNPHNITAEAPPDIANVTPKPSITTNSNYTITFTKDTNPSPPWKLAAVSVSDDVVLTWDYFTLPDLALFEIYRSTDPTDFDTTPIGTAAAFERSYVDNDGASDWTTYYYQVRANDTAGNLGYPSNTAKCGDWVVSSGNKSFVPGMIIELNGTLVIEDGGTLELVSTHLKINATSDGQFGITVLAGGVLEITDTDDNALTTGDASNISALDPDNSIYFIVEQDGILYMNNSMAYGIGHPPITGPFDGIKVYGNNSIIRGNNIISTAGTSSGLVIIGAGGVEVRDNRFEYFSDHTIILSYARECIVDDNTITGSDANGIDMAYTFNVTVSNNTITGCIMGIYNDRGDGDVIENNLVYKNVDYGLYLYVTTGALIYNNTVKDHRGDTVKDVGIYLYFVTDCRVEDNTLDNNEKGIYGSRISSTIVISNDIQNTNREGITINRCTHTLWQDNMVNNSGITGIYIDQVYLNTTVIGGNTSNSQNGFLIEDSYDVTIAGVDVWNNMNAMAVTDCEYIDVRDCWINASTSYGLLLTSSFTPTLYSLRLENCSISNPKGKDVYVSDQGWVFLINISIPYEQIGFKGPFGKIGVFWYAHIHVEDMFGQPAAWANVTIKLAGGQTFVRQTDTNGLIQWQLLHDKTMLLDGNFTSNPYTITAVLGNHTGTNSTNIDQFTIVYVKLENKAPSALNVQLAPVSPTTLDSLTVSFDYQDPENDPEFPYSISWFADGVEQGSLANQKTVTSASTQKGQNWYARVTVFDGADYSIAVDSNIVTIKNTKPTVSGVTISPSSPSSKTDIGVTYSFSDVDDDDEGDTLVSWYVDRGTGFVDSGLSGTVLNYTQTKKGESWKARVLPHDGEDYGSSADSNTLDIGNSPPEARSIMITPAEPTSTEDLTVEYSYFDIDDDAEGTGTFRWYYDRGTGYVDSGITADTVPASVTKKGDLWRCEYTPHDGFEYGPAIVSDPVTIGNSPPSVTNIVISPKNPLTTNPSRYDDLEVSYNYSDPDGDPEDENATSIKWFVKKKGVSGFAFFSNDWSITGSDLTKGDEWMCEIRPSDGEDTGNFTASQSSIFVVNAPPEASELLITPSDPRQGMSLTANYKYFDIDGDLEDTSKRNILWYRDGVHAPDYDDMVSVPENVIKKGETWYFTLRPHDGEDYGPGQQSPSFKVSSDVKIGNTAPTVDNTTISPSEPTSADDLTALYKPDDIDGDTMEKVEIHWFRNEVHIESFNNLPVISSDMTFKGDVWYFKIRVYDGLAYSDWMTSPPKLVVNSPPSITLHSPDSLEPTINENEELTFLVDATDLDKDDLTYLWFVNDEIEGIGKVFALETDYNSERWYEVRIEVSDGDEKVKLHWNVSVTDVNRQPVITVQTPEGKRDIEMTTLDTQEFIVVKNDADEEDKGELDITWYLDDEEVLSGDDRYVYQPSAASAGDHEIKVEVTDGKDTVTETWNISVKKEEEKDTTERLMGQTYDWWGLVMAILSAVAAVIMFVFGVLRVRKKKGKLKEYMDRIEGITDSDMKIRKKEKALVDLKKQVKSEFSQGLVSENHYIILEREIDDALGEIRKDMVGGAGVAMSGKLRSEVDEILEDGIVTKKEYQKAKRLIETSEDLSSEDKARLDRMMKKWAREEERERGREVESRRGREGVRKRGESPERRAPSPEEDEPAEDDDDNELDFLDDDEEDDDW